MAEIDRIDLLILALRQSGDPRAKLGPSRKLYRLAADELSRLRGREEEYRKALEAIAEFSSGDDTTLGALKRLIEIRSIAARLLSPTNQKGDQDGGKHGGGL